MRKMKLKDGRVLTIREAVKGDAKALIEYLDKISSETEFVTAEPGEIKLSIESEEKFIENHHKFDNWLFIVAEVDKRIVGSLDFAGGRRQRTKHAGEFGVSVLKTYWGLGVGRALMLYMVDWAKKTGIVKKINLRVREGNERAIQLYRKLEFKKEGIISRGLCIHGKNYSFILMGLEID